MNGFSTEEDSRDGGAGAPGFGHICCLVDDGERCNRPAGNASFSKRIQKSISQKKLKLETDKNVSLNIFFLNCLHFPDQSHFSKSNPSYPVNKGRGRE